MTLLPAQASSERQPDPAVYRHARMARDYLTSYVRSRGELRSFRSIERYCMFIGHARSGHSIVGAMLDAHPNVILPDEVDALRYVAAGFSREQLFHILLSRSRRQVVKERTKAGRNGKSYSYRVPDQWQGRFSTLKVIGDSKAGKSTQRLAQSPSILDRLRRCMGPVDLRFIHVVRNPYDNISTLMVRGGRSFDNAITQYFANCQALVAIRQRVGDSLLTIRQEQVILQPALTLRQLCDFLQLTAPDDYLHACAGILYTSLPKSRYSVAWDDALIERVRRQIEQFDFLAGYAYEERAANAGESAWESNPIGAAE